MDFERQLSNREDPALSPAVREYLAKLEDAPADGDFGYRFVWEMKRGKDPKDALQDARFAAAVAPSPSVSPQAAVSEIREAICRRPVRLERGQHRTLDDAGKLTVINLSEQDLTVSAAEMQLAFEQLAHGRPLTVVLEEHEHSTVRAGEGDALVWTVPPQMGALHQPWQELAAAVAGDEEPRVPAWVAAVADHRYPVSVTTLPNEHQVRSDRIRGLVAEILTFFDYGTPGAMHELDESEALWLLDQVDSIFDRYATQPRMVLPCASLANLGPAEEWQTGSRNLRSLVNLVTGDDRRLGSFLGSSDALRAGALAFVGDPDKDGSDLLSLTMGDFPYGVVLKRDVLERAVFLAGRPHPTADLPVPQRRFGFYSTIATEFEVRDMLRTRIYLELSPAFGQHTRAYFQGRDQQLGIAHGAGNAAFQTLVAGIASARKPNGELDEAQLEQPLRVAVARAMHQVLASPDDAVYGLLAGGLHLDDIEQVIVSLGSFDEFHQYLRTGELPFYLTPARDFFSEHQIQLRPRPPAGAAARRVA